ncbi:MAG TPA: hypothetical protein VFH22_00735 [Rhodocyclaceae bacterium]|nr:hypothetical protein [Rhodocyclaceae bacterium]
MRHLFFAAALAAAAPAFAADVGVSVSIGQPGFYGQIDIGGAPPPVLLYRQPVMIERVDVERAPIYLNVRPGHARNWRRHCGEYDACGERVYFVQNGWYDRQYVPHYKKHKGNRHDDEGRDDDRRGGDHRGDDRGRNR